MVGRARGNRDPQRARLAGHAAVMQCSLLGIFITLAFTLGAGLIFEQMHTDAVVRDLGSHAFPLVGLFHIPLLAGIIYAAALRGAGDTRYPLIVTAISTYALRLPLAWLLGHTLGWGLWGAWGAMCADMLVRWVMAWGRFVQGGWLRIKV